MSIIRVLLYWIITEAESSRKRGLAMHSVCLKHCYLPTHLPICHQIICRLITLRFDIGIFQNIISYHECTHTNLSSNIPPCFTDDWSRMQNNIYFDKSKFENILLTRYGFPVNSPHTNLNSYLFKLMKLAACPALYSTIPSQTKRLQEISGNTTTASRQAIKFTVCYSAPLTNSKPMDVFKKTQHSMHYPPLFLGPIYPSLNKTLQSKLTFLMKNCSKDILDEHLIPGIHMCAYIKWNLEIVNIRNQLWNLKMLIGTVSQC